MRLRSIFTSAAALVFLDALTRISYLAPRLLTWRGFANYVLSIAALLLLLRLLMIAERRLRLGIFVLLISIPMTIQWAVFRAYGQFVNPADFSAFADSPRIAWFAGRSAIHGVGALGIFVATLVGAALLPRAARSMKKRELAIVSTVLTILIMTGTWYWRASPSLEHSEPAFVCSLVGVMKRVAIRSQVGSRPVVPKTSSSTKLPNIVLVIGESLTASHLSLYGYPRETSPQLQKLFDQHELVAMQDALVLGPNTRTSVPYILTGMEGPDPAGRVFGSPTILEYAKARGYHTALVSAQEEAWGNFDVLLHDGADTFQTGIDFAVNVNVLKGADDLVVLDRAILKAIGTTTEPFFLVLHMDGSHMPYDTHSPRSHKLFPEEGPNSIGAYDNTVRVTDEYLARVFTALRDRDPEAWLFFTSDHGQPLGEGGAFFNHGYQSNIVRDPLLVFPPPQVDQTRWDMLSHAPVSACDLAPTLLHLMGAAQVVPMDCVDWLGDLPSARERVVSAYTPTYVNEPTLLVKRADGKSWLYDLGRNDVTLDDGSVHALGEFPLSNAIASRLH